MQFRIEDNDSNKIQSNNVVPGHCRKLLIPFAKVTYTEGPFGNIFSQEIITKYYTIEYHHFEIKQKVCLYQTSEKPSITLNYLLKGNIHCTISSEEFILLEENYYLFNMLETEHKMSYEPGVYDSFHIHSDPKYLETYSRKYERLNKLRELMQNDKTSALKFSDQIIYSERSIIQQILNCSDDELENAMLQNFLASQLIFKFLRDIQSLFEFRQRKTGSRKLEKIKMYILNNLGDELTIETLATRFAISEGSLRRHFKKQFNLTLHVFIKDERMQLAIKLLVKNIPIQEIARLTGFSDTQAFSNAFSAYYKTSPSKYRLNFEQNDEQN